MRLSSVTRFALSLATLAILACGGGGGDGTTSPPVTTGGFTVSLSSTSLSVQAGSSGTLTANISRTGSFAGTVTLALENVPSGLTASFSPAVIATGTTSTTLTVSAAAAVAPGNYSFTIRASAAGQSDQTISATVSVTAAPPAQGFSLAAGNQTLQQGQSGQVTVTITRTGGFAGSVSLAVTSGLTTGITAAFNPNPVSGTSATLTFTLTAAAPVGTRAITIEGTATGLAAQTVQLQLTVTAAPVPAFTLALAPTQLSVQQGASGSTTATITRSGGFAGDVTLTATSGVPAGVTVAFSANPVSGASSTITLTVGAAVAPGPYSINIRGTGTGVTEQNQTVALTVTAAPSGGGNITTQFCGDATTIPIWVAVKNGAGNFTQVTAGANNTYQFNITANGGIAWVTQNAANDFDLSIWYGTLSDFQGFASSFCRATKTVTGTVSGVAAGEQATISLGGGLATVTGPATNWTATGVAQGNQDLLAVRSTLSGFSFVPNNFVLNRNLNIPDNGSAGNVAFAGATPLANASATVSNSNGELVSAFTLYYTANTPALSIGIGDVPSAAATRSIYGIPAASQAASDLHMLITSSTVIAGFTPVSVRTHSSFFKTFGNRNVTLGAVMSTPTLSTASTTGHAQLRVQQPVQSDYDDLFVIGYGQSSGGQARSVTIQATSAYLAGATTFDTVIPSFSGTSGWLNTWGLQSGSSVTWAMNVSGWTIPGNPLGPAPLDGTVILTAIRYGTLTP